MSIIIPAFNEAAKIAADVEAASRFLTDARLQGEIIVVDDGSTDGSAAVAESVPVPEGMARRVIRGQGNHGKGYAVRRGVADTGGRYVLFADSGLCVPFENALRGLELIRRGQCDIAHGSRHLPQSTLVRDKTLYRRMVTRVFRWVVPALMHVPRHLTDTQCGFKLYRGSVARELYAQCVCDGFLFDVEVILRAVQKGHRIEEFPVEWRSDPDSRLHPARRIPRLLGQLWTIRRAVRREGQSAPHAS